MDEVAKINTAGQQAQKSQQYLTFMLSDEEYGVDVLAVQELRGWENTTSIPNAPSGVLGVINLRGKVIPVIDLRDRFGLERKAHGSTTVVIVIKPIIQGKEQVAGLVVDAVSEVYGIGRHEMQPPPDMDGAIARRFVTGLATMDNKMVILLDINTLISDDLISSESEVNEQDQEIAAAA